MKNDTDATDNISYDEPVVYINARPDIHDEWDLLNPFESNEMKLIHHTKKRTSQIKRKRLRQNQRAARKTHRRKK